MTRPNPNSQPIHGNYHGYYSKRPLSEDARLELVPPALFKGARVLDIGCNEGWITCQIAQLKGSRKVIGVDIDDTLIRAAWKRRRTVWSMQGQTEPLEDEYFPSSCEHMYGPLPIPSQGMDAAYPHNVVFFCADWVNTEIIEDNEGYDVVIAFSVSKWIHLNGGDDGLMQFFRRVHSVLKPGGTFVFEPQEWDGYAKARRMDPKLKDNGRKLQIRPEQFEELLMQVGFSSPEHLGRPGEGGFRRPIDLYHREAI
ncbi:Bin3-domain-containing protein [Trametopsis cervina]|nr:Bin3-domain-containing protein [Trametopsis cervina]